tara:strand:+ start:56 stop:508 length:453 start_codon:yes stop_codon:yes gene_type:complete
MKKLLVIFSIILLSSCGGYKPIFKSKETNFYISKINNLSQDKISNQIKMSLNPYSKDNGKMSIILELDSKKNEKVLSKDSKGNPVVYEIKILTKAKIIFEDSSEEEFKFEKKFNFNNQSNKFEFQQYKNNIEKNLANEIFESLILKLRSI